MYMVCLKSKFGYCKYRKQCDKIHFTDECELLEICTEKYCDKYHLSYAITLKNTRYVNLAYTVFTSVLKS